MIVPALWLVPWSFLSRRERVQSPPVGFLLLGLISTIADRGVRDWSMESLSSALESSLRGSSEYEQSVPDDSTDSGQAGDLDLDLDFDFE